MRFIQKTDAGCEIALSVEELRVVNNALNEICNGLDIEEFHTRVGATRESARALLQSVHEAIRRAT